MGKIALILLLVYCAFAPNCTFVESGQYFAFAEGGQWARIVRTDTYLYATEDCSKQTFALEKSYYVEILDTLERTYFVRVDCQDKQFPVICGYVLKNEVRVVEDVPQSPLYPTEKLVVSGASASLRLAPTPSSDAVVVATNTQKICYYGTISNYGKSWYYVYFAGQFGYVLAEDVTSPKVQLHPVAIDIPQNVPAIAPSSDEEDTPTEQPVSPTAEIILTVFVSLLALAITFSLFLPVKSKKQVFDGDI